MRCVGRVANARPGIEVIHSKKHGVYKSYREILHSPIEVLLAVPVHVTFSARLGPASLHQKPKRTNRGRGVRLPSAFRPHEYIIPYTTTGSWDKFLVHTGTLIKLKFDYLYIY